jgi:hypothetical protein
MKTAPRIPFRRPAFVWVFDEKAAQERAKLEAAMRSGRLPQWPAGVAGNDRRHP